MIRESIRAIMSASVPGHDRASPFSACDFSRNAPSTTSRLASLEPVTGSQPRRPDRDRDRSGESRSRSRSLGKKTHHSLRTPLNAPQQEPRGPGCAAHRQATAAVPDMPGRRRPDRFSAIDSNGIARDSRVHLSRRADRLAPKAFARKCGEGQVGRANLSESAPHLARTRERSATAVSDWPIRIRRRRRIKHLSLDDGLAFQHGTADTGDRSAERRCVARLGPASPAEATPSAVSAALAAAARLWTA